MRITDPVNSELSGGSMDKKHLVVAVILLMFYMVIETAYAIQYSGEITHVSTSNPYAKVGDHFNIQVDYDTVNMIASQIIVNLESWGEMYPASGSTGSYFSAPDSWDYSNSSTHWALSGNIFLLESEGMGNGPFTIIGHVVPVPEPATLFLLSVGLILVNIGFRFFKGTVRTIM